MHIALDRRHQHFALRLRVARRQLFGLHVGQQDGHGALHHAGAFDHLRQKHLAGPEQVADNVHAGHQRPFNHFQRLRVLLPGFFGVGLNVVRDAFDQRMDEPLFHRSLPPGFLHFLGRGRRP